MDIGNRIKQLRIRNDLTLEDLASRCELTKGFLSQLERNLTSPSIQTLEDITQILGVSLSEFFKEDKNEQIVFKEEDTFIDEHNGVTTHWIVPNSQKNEMEPIILELNPNCKSNIIYPHEGEEFGYVLSGKVQLIISNNKKTKFTVKKGESFYISGSKEHYINNPFNSKAKILWVCNPPIF